MSIASPIKRHGGKYFLAKRFVELMPPHTRYCEAFFGSGAVLFEKQFEGISEFVNDLDRHLANFWTVLRHEHLFSAFQRAVECTPLSQDEFTIASNLKCLEWNGDIPSEGKILRAVAFFVRNRQSRQALEKSFCTPSSRTRRGMNENVSAWLSAVEGLPEIHARLKRVEVRNQDAVDFIQELDADYTLHLCDPPYCHSTRSATKAYEHEMTDEQHAALLDTLSQVKGKFMLSGYQSEMYDNAATKHGWNRHDFVIDNKSSSAKVKEKKTECLWCNF